MGSFEITSRTALLVIDMQRAIDEPYWARDGGRNHPNAERAALRLLESWRAAQRPIYHIRHDSADPQSAYRPGQSGNQFKPGFEPQEGEPVIAKHTGSAFTGTPLERMLRERGQSALVAAGVITNNSVEATVRHAGTLGFEVTLAEDACFTFARRDWNGVLRSAEEVHAMSLANLDEEYCRVVTAAEVLAVAGSPVPILPYADRPAAYGEWDSRATAAAAYLRALIESSSAGARVEHFGPTAVPGCPGKNVIDLLVIYTAGALESIRRGLDDIGFQPQTGCDPFLEDRPMRVGTVAHLGRLWRIHAHVIQAGTAEIDELLYFRDRLRADDSLRDAYASEKRSIPGRGIRDSLDSMKAKSDLIRGRLNR